MLAFESRYINRVLLTSKYTSYSLKSADSENVYFTLLNCNACCPGVLPWLPSIYAFSENTIQAGMG